MAIARDARRVLSLAVLVLAAAAASTSASDAECAPSREAAAFGLRDADNGRRAQQAPGPQLTPIVYLSYAEIVARLHALAAAAPDFVRVWSAQEVYGLPSPGACGAVPCQHWFVTLTRFNATTVASTGVGDPPLHRAGRPDALEDRPHVFLSGNLHGDEQVGPMTLVYTLEHLVRVRLAGDNAWVNRLVDTRYTVAIPVTNPIGCVGCLTCGRHAWPCAPGVAGCNGEMLQVRISRRMFASGSHPIPPTSVPCVTLSTNRRPRCRCPAGTTTRSARRTAWTPTATSRTTSSRRSACAP